MKIASLVWLGNTIGKLEQKHNVRQQEVVEVFANAPYLRFAEKGHNREGEDVYSALGRTDAGRYLIAYFIYKLDRSALVLSARDMTRAERRKYEQR